MLKRNTEKPSGGKELIRKAVAGKQGESRKEYLARASRETGIGYWTLVQIWQDAEWQHKARARLVEVIENENNLSSKVQQLIAHAEATANHAELAFKDDELRGAFRNLVEQARSIDRRLGGQMADPYPGKALKIAIAFAVACSALLFLAPYAEAQYVW